jgi:hypothetical protein
MRYRKLRIAFSAACLIACVLELSLRTRSFTLDDNLSGEVLGYRLHMQSRNGHQQLEAVKQPQTGPRTSSGPLFHLRSGSSDLGSEILPWYFNIQRTPLHALQIAVPHWGLAAIIATLAAIPWLGKLPWRFSWRFTLRTLLIVTTLVAVVLGLIVWLK